VLCIDEKPQTQALERKAPVLPLRPGVLEKRSHDYIRHGTISLFAALEAATGKMIGACYPQHRHQEFLAFLRQVARACPRVPLHIVVDKYGTRKHPTCRRGWRSTPDHLVTDPRLMAAQRVRRVIDRPVGKQRGELVPKRIQQP
jgi:hypothetical protein